METRKIPELQAIVLAGAMTDTADDSGTLEPRAMLEIGGMPMFKHVINALRQSGIRDIVVVGRPALPDSTEYRLYRSEYGITANVRNGLGRVIAPMVLVCFDDTPFVEPEAIQDLVARAQNTDADVIYTVASLEKCAREFKGMAKTSFRLREGRFCGAGVIVVKNLDAARKATDHIEALHTNRKTKHGLALTLGIRAACRAVMTLLFPNTAGLETVEAILTRRLGLTVKILEVPPCLAIDIDDRSKHMQACALWNQRHSLPTH